MESLSVSFGSSEVAPVFVAGSESPLVSNSLLIILGLRAMLALILGCLMEDFVGVSSFLDDGALKSHEIDKISQNSTFTKRNCHEN